MDIRTYWLENDYIIISRLELSVAEGRMDKLKP